VFQAKVNHLHLDCEVLFEFFKFLPCPALTMRLLVVQVEHPVTEWIAEFNLPAAQLGVAMGIPLWRMPGKGPFSYSNFLLSFSKRSM